MSTGMSRSLNQVFRSFATTRGSASLPDLAISFNDPLDTADPEIEKRANLPKTPIPSITQTSRLANGLTVTTVEQHGPLSTVYLAIQAGSRHETPKSLGVSQVLKSMNFQASERRSGLRLVREMEKIGSQYNVSLDRDLLTFSVACARDHVPEAIELIADGIHSPEFDQYEVSRAVNAAITQSENSSVMERLVDSLHLNAYRGSGLAHALYSSQSRLGNVTGKCLESFWKENVCPQRSAIVGVNVPHDSLVAVLQKELGTHVWISEKSPSNVSPSAPALISGGETFLDGFDNDNPYGTILLGFHSPGWVSNLSDLAPLFVLQGLMGGEEDRSTVSANNLTSLSFQVPLKESIQSTRCLSKKRSVQATQYLYADTGLFTLKISDNHEKMMETALAAVASLKSASKSITEEQLSRAKNACLYRLATSMNQRDMLVDSIARKSLFHHKYDTSDIIQQVSKTTSADVRRATENLLKVRPVASSYGDVYSMPSLSTLKL